MMCVSKKRMKKWMKENDENNEEWRNDECRKMKWNNEIMKKNNEMKENVNNKIK